MSELARDCQPSNQRSVFQQLDLEQTSLYRQLTDQKHQEPTTEWVIQSAERNLDQILKTHQPEPSTEDVINAADYLAKLEARTQPSIDDMNKILRDSRIDWNTKLQEMGYKQVDDKTVALGDMLVVTGRELPIIIESDPQRDFTEHNYDNLTDAPMKHWRKSK